MRDLRVYIAVCVAAVPVLCGCDRYDLSGFFRSPSITVDRRWAESVEMNGLVPGDTLITVPGDSYAIYAASDFHIETTAGNLARFVRVAAADSSAALALILGDVTDQKGGHEIAGDTLSRVERGGMPLRAVVGNHDLYFNQWESYKSLFGSSTYFVAIQTRDTADLLIGLDSGSGTLGRGQREWLEDVLESRRNAYRHCIVATHTNFWDTDLGQMPSGCFTLEETAALTGLFSKYNVTVVLNGHDHNHEIHRFGATTYITAGEAADRSERAGYVRLSVGEGVEYEQYRLE